MTVIVVNAISIKGGGSLVVLRALLGGMAALRTQWRWYVVVNSKVTNPLPDLPNVEYVRFPEVDRSGVRTRLWYETGLPALLKRVDADILFSITNYLPLRRTPCHSLLLVQHAGHFSPVFRQLTEARLGLLGRVGWRLKGHWVRSSVRVADAVTVQTDALAKQIAHEVAISPGHIQVIPHGAGQAMLQPRPVAPPLPGGNFRVGFITGYGVQKNFTVLFAAMAALKKNGIPFALVLTLSEGVPENREVLESARHYGVADIIENHGELSPDEIDRLYKTLHAFVFPSLCESLGLPMVEAMAYGIPLLVADLDSNVEVAGAGGQKFPAHDPEMLAYELERLANDVAWFRQRGEASLARGREFNWAWAATGTLSLMDKLVFHRGGGAASTEQSEDNIHEQPRSSEPYQDAL